MPDTPPPDAAKVAAEGRAKRRIRKAVIEAVSGPGALPAMSGRVVMLDAGLHIRADDRLRQVAGRFDVIAQTRDETGSGWGLLIRFVDPDNQFQSVVIPREHFVGEKTEIAATLAARGLYVFPGRAAAGALCEYLAGCLATDKRVTVVMRTGWHQIDGAQVFVLPNETIGEIRSEVMYSPEGAEPPPFNASGTLGEWRSGVAERCSGNKILILAVCAAFAAPLLGPLAEPGGGFHLHGYSSTGKTTALRVAASVWGGAGKAGADAYIRQWRATGNGVEGLAQAHSDSLLAIDEIGTADPATLGETAYMLANGRGRERLGRDGRARRVVTFRSLFLSTGEPSFAVKLSEVAKHPRAGQERRMIDFPADAGAAMGVFEDIGDAGGAEAFALALRAATAAAYGTAGPAFLHYLTAQIAAEPDFAAESEKWNRDLVAGWLEGMPGADGQVRSVARRFALLGIAGELATRAGITGWGPSEAQDMMGRCFAAWAAARGMVGPREDGQAVQQLRDFIGRHGVSRFEDWKERDQDSGYQADPEARPPPAGFRPINRAGWRRWIREEPGGPGAYRYFLHHAAMAEALAGLDQRQAHKVLIARGFLLADAAGKPSRSVRPPGHAKARLYEVTGAILAADDGSD